MEVRGLTPKQSVEALGKQVQRFTVRTFENVLAEEAGRGFDRKPIIQTDGYLGRDPRTVRNFGRIEARSRAEIGVVAFWLKAELERLSPVLTGAYQRAHVVLADGQPAERPADLVGARRVMVVNPMPYAAKIEGVDAFTRWETKGGKKSRRAQRRAQGWKAGQMRGQSKQAPNGVYRVALRNLQKKFGRSVVALYQPQALPGGVTVGAKGRKRGRAQVYPAIILATLQ